MFTEQTKETQRDSSPKGKPHQGERRELTSGDGTMKVAPRSERSLGMQRERRGGGAGGGGGVRAGRRACKRRPQVNTSVVGNQFLAQTPQL